MLELLSLWYLEFCLWTIEGDKILVSFLILSQISINESFGTSFKAWKHSFLTILRSLMLLLTAAIMLSRKIKEALRGIYRHDFCRSSEFEHNKILNLKNKPFGYFWLLLYFSSKILWWLYLVILFSILNKFLSNCVVCRDTFFGKITKSIEDLKIVRNECFHALKDVPNDSFIDICERIKNETKSLFASIVQRQNSKYQRDNIPKINHHQQNRRFRHLKRRNRNR